MVKSRIIFFGTPEFSVVILKALIEHGMKPIAVVTAPDKPRGRGKKLTRSSVKLLAENESIPTLEPDKLDSGFVLHISSFKPDIFVVASYGKIIPRSVLDIPPHGTINVHPSLLPKYRGPSPIQTAILNGDETTGVTLILTDEKMDHGPVLSQAELGISHSQFLVSKITYTELHNKLAKLGAALLIETLPKWLNREIIPQEQDHIEATLTKMLTKEDGRIDWSKTAGEIDRQVRAFEVWPGSFCEWERNGKGIYFKIISGHPEKVRLPLGDRASRRGIILKTERSELAVKTKSGLYVIDRVQPEGKGIMNGKDFLNGHPGIVGNSLL